MLLRPFCAGLADIGPGICAQACMSDDCSTILAEVYAPV
jgi:hypothetical protein